MRTQAFTMSRRETGNAIPLSRGPTRTRRVPDQARGDGCIVPLPPEAQCYKVDRGIQVFSRYNRFTDDTYTEIAPETPEFFSYRFASTPDSTCDECKFWNVEVWGNEVEQVNQPADGLVDQLGPSSIMSVGRQHSRLKVRIIYHASSGGAVRILDIGQGIRVGLNACRVTVEALIPATAGGPTPGFLPVNQQGAYFIGQAGGTALPQLPQLNNGLILNTLLGAFICEGYPPGDDSGTNTITVRIAAGVANVLTPVPPGTRRVTIYQTGIGDIATPQWLLFNDVASPSLGQITIGANRRVVNLDRPGAAEAISSGPADANAVRVITYIFSLEM